MRIMGLDYGSVTVGVAISDALLITAQGIETIRRKEENKLRRTLARIEELVKEYEVELIVVGLPKNMNNTLGTRAEKSKEFAQMVKRRTGLDVIMWDERLSTVAAHNAMLEADISRKKNLFFSFSRYQYLTISQTSFLQRTVDHNMVCAIL